MVDQGEVDFPARCRRDEMAAGAPALLAMAGDYVPQRTDYHIAHATTEAATGMPVVHG
jgi:hypothetical protein